MRRCKIIFIATGLIGVPGLAVALLLMAPSKVLEVRLARVLRNGGKPPGAFGDQRTLDLAGKPGVTAETWKAELRIQVPPERKIWLTQGRIGVETLGARGDWIRTASSEGVASGSGRTISRTVWLTLPADVKRCRFTIGYRGPTLQEQGRGLLERWGCWRRFPAASGWIIKYLPKTDPWREYRCELPVTASMLEPEAHTQSVEPTGGSRFCPPALASRRRLPRVAHARR